MSDSVTPYYLPLDLALIRWSVVHLKWSELANDIPSLPAFLGGWGCRCVGMKSPDEPIAFRDSFRCGWREADEQIAIALQQEKVRQ